MNTAKRAARAKRRAKSNRLVRQGVPFHASKFSVNGTWRWPQAVRGWGALSAVGQWQSFRKLARRPDPMDVLDGSIFPDYLQAAR